MGLFNFKKGKEKEIQKIDEQKKVIKSIYDIFTIDLINLPDDTFTKGETETNEEGAVFTSYRKILDPKELGLFDSLEIRVFEGNENKNFSFNGIDFDTKDISKVKQLINNLYLLYGTTHLGTGKFNNEDDSELKSDFWMGRTWLEEKYNMPLMISYDDEDGISMRIWKKDGKLVNDLKRDKNEETKDLLKEIRERKEYLENNYENFDEYEVTGVHIDKRKKYILEQCTELDEVVLFPDKNNSYSKRAMSIIHDEMIIGYISEDDLDVAHEIIKKQYIAKISSIDYEGSYLTVYISIKY